ncbi:MAG: hypothetical protein NTX33_19135 [Propionibacteriales bacterium]|nr:hypothetical protein [Propionibacteriales bacterium]
MCRGSYPSSKTCRTYFDRELTKAAWKVMKPLAGDPAKAAKSAKRFCSRGSGYAKVACLAAMAAVYVVTKQIKQAASGNDCWAFRYRLGVRPPFTFMYSYVSDTSACRT